MDPESGSYDMGLPTSTSQSDARCAGAARGRCPSGDYLNGRLCSVIHQEETRAVFRGAHLDSNRAVPVTQAEEDFPRLIDVQRSPDLPTLVDQLQRTTAENVLRRPTRSGLRCHENDKEQVHGDQPDDQPMLFHTSLRVTGPVSHSTRKV